MSVKRKYNEEAAESPVSHPHADSDTSAWSAEEKLALVKSIQDQCPDNDKLSHQVRGNKINWFQISINGRSPADCRALWEKMLKKVRKFRTMKEVLADVEDIVLHPNKYEDKKIKHPDEPSKPLTPYFQYYMDHRDKIKAKHPDLNNVELTKKISQKWKSLPEVKQLKYQEKFQQEKQEYLKALTKFFAQHPELVKNEIKKQKKPSPPVPVLLYIEARLTSYMEKHPQLNKNVAKKRLQLKYSKLKEEKKKKWIKRAVEAIPEYEEKIREYKISNPDYQPPEKKVRLTREEQLLNEDTESNKFNEDATKLNKSTKHHFPGAPVKPPQSAFQLFVEKKFNEVEGPMASKMAELGHQWQATSDKKKRHYQKKLTSLQTQYQEELVQFEKTLSPEDLLVFKESLKPKKRMQAKQKTKSAIDRCTS